jgi:hypothetical protein
VHVDRCPDVDPLFEITCWRERVSSVTELTHLLRCYAATSGHAATKEWQKAVAYVNAYTTPVVDASIDRLLDGVGLLKEATAR